TWHAVYLGQRDDRWMSLLQRLAGDPESAPPAQGRDFAAMLTERQSSLFGRVLVGAERLLGTRGVQVYCLECPAQAGQPRKSAGELETLAWLGARLGLR